MQFWLFEKSFYLYLSYRAVAKVNDVVQSGDLCVSLALRLINCPRASHLVFRRLGFVMVPEASLRMGNNGREYTFSPSQLFHIVKMLYG